MPGFVPPPPPDPPDPPASSSSGSGSTAPPPPPPPPVQVRRPPPIPSGPSVYGTPGSPAGSGSGSSSGSSSSGSKSSTRFATGSRTRGTATSRRGSGGPTPTPPPPGTAATGGSGKGWGKLLLAPVAIVVAVVIGVNASNGGSDDPDPDDPFAPLVQPDRSTQIWSINYPYDEPRPMDGPVDGGDWFDQRNVLAVDDVLVQRLAEDPYEGPAQGVVALGADDGEVRWERDLPRAVCDAVPGTLAAPSFLACASADDSGSWVQLLDPATGETRQEWSLATPAAMIRATPTGVVTIDVPDETTGRTLVRWYSLLGAGRWTFELPDEVLEEAVSYDDEDGWEISSALEILRIGSGSEVMVTSYSGALRADESGYEVIEECWSPAAVAGGVVCEGYPETTLLVDGERVWASEDLELVSFDSDRSRPPALITRERGDGESDPDTFRWVDPATGVPGAELLSAETYVRGFGTAEHPVLLVQEDTDEYDEPVGTTMVVIDPESGTVAWTIEFMARNYTEVAVIGDRVLVEIDYGSWTVLDAASGEVVGGMEARGSRDWVDVGGDAVVAEGSYGLSRLDLP